MRPTVDEVYNKVVELGGDVTPRQIRLSFGLDYAATREKPHSLQRVYDFLRAKLGSVRGIGPILTDERTAAFVQELVNPTPSRLVVYGSLDELVRSGRVKARPCMESSGAGTRHYTRYLAILE